jgi:hypothetical protein
MEPMFIVAATEEKPDVKRPFEEPPEKPDVVKQVRPDPEPDLGDRSITPVGRDEREPALGFI